MKITLSIFSLFLFLITTNAYAEPVVNIRTTYYDISGQTNEALRREMARKGPILSDRRYWASAQWHVSWNADYQILNHDKELARRFYSSAPNLRVGTGCQVKSVQTTVSIQYTYPRWVNPANPYTNMGRKWDRMYRALVAHEQTHGSHGISAARQIESELLQLSSNDHCGNFMREVNTRAQQIIRRYQDADVQFDRRSNHGFNDGIRLP